MNQKILALDLDGTTVDDRGMLHEPTKDALRRARAAGHLVCFVTGRRDIDMHSIRDEWPRLADYLILNNGGKLIRSSDRQVLFNQYIFAPDAKRLIEYCLANDYQLHVLNGLYWAVNRWSDGLQDYVDLLGTKPELYHRIEEVPWETLEGMMATVDQRPVSSYIDENGIQVEYVDSEPGTIDIMPKGVHKWNGVERFLKRMGCSAGQVIAVGDYDSDVTMLRGAGIGVAVNNAQACAKNAADFITTHDNNHDAVVDIVDDLLLGLHPGLCIPAK